MQKVISRDGTPIAYDQSGTGPPLVLVHGTAAAHPAAWPAFPALEQHFSLYAPYRRGRGESGDEAPYAVEREFEDIAAVVDAVVDAVGEPAHLLGHSFGGLCALEAARLTNHVGKLVLYEPSIEIPGVSSGDEALASRLQALLEAGETERMLTTFYSSVMTPDDVERLRSSPVWPERLAVAPTVPRELWAEVRYVFDARRFTDLHIPTLLLTGEDSQPFLKAGAQALDRALPDSRIDTLPGQQHVAMYTAPNLFADEVLRFLKGPAVETNRPPET